MTSKLLCVNIINSDDICIESISFSKCGQYLAASYGNNIAIYEVLSSFLLTTLSDYNTDASFRSILWIPFKNFQNFKLSDYRLFTVGLHGIITEWDLSLFKTKEFCNSYGGAIFSGVVSPNSDLLVTCDDGCVRSFSIWDQHNDIDRKPCLDFKKVQVTHTNSILSICCLKDGRFFCGTSDSLILICNLEKDNYTNLIKVSSKKMNKRVNKDSEATNEDEDTVKGIQEIDEMNEKNKNNEYGNVHIWCLEYLNNNRLASGDSNGNVMMWDLETLTMVQLFTQHNSDVLSLVLLNKNTLFSAGLDSKVTMYTNNNASNTHYSIEAELYLNNDLEEIEMDNSKLKDGWSVNGFKYPVKGDIRTLGVNSIEELVASAGNYGCISICKGEKFLNHKKSKYRFIYPNIYPFNPVISMNVYKNMALVRYSYHCDLWYLPTTYSDNNLDLDFSTSLDKKNNIYKQNDRFESEIPYKLCTMKMNMNKGKIKSCCLSPEGDIVVISNEQCLRILLVNLDDLKISQLKFEYPDLIVTSMAFMSNTHLLLTHYKEWNIVSVYNISEGTLRDLVYLDFNKHVIKVTIHNNNNNLDNNQNNNYNQYYNSNQNYINPSDSTNNTNSSNGDNNESNNTNTNNINNNNNYYYTTHLSDYGYGVFYCLDGTVYVVDFGNESYFKLPKFESGSRICSVTFSTWFKHLIAFSTNFKYYIFDMNRKSIIRYQDQFIHNINSKFVNTNSVICNSFWLSNIVIAHTSYNIFYFKLVEYPFNKQEQRSLNTPTSTETNSSTQNITSTVTPTQSSNNSNNNKEKEGKQGKNLKKLTQENSQDDLMNTEEKERLGRVESIGRLGSSDRSNRENNIEYRSHKEGSQEEYRENMDELENMEVKSTLENMENMETSLQDGREYLEYDIITSTPKQTKQHINSFEDMFLTQTSEYKRFITPGFRKNSTIIAPRRLYQIPSIEHYVYDLKEMINNEFNEISNFNVAMNNLFESSQSGESRDNRNNNSIIGISNIRSSSDNLDSSESGHKERSDVSKDTPIRSPKNKEKEGKEGTDINRLMERIRTNESYNSLRSSESFYSVDSLDASGFELESGKSVEKCQLKRVERVQSNEKDNKEDKDRETGDNDKNKENNKCRKEDKEYNVDYKNQEKEGNNNNKENEYQIKLMKSNEKYSIKYNNIIKSKFIVHADLFFREQQINIIAFKTSLKDEVMRQKRYGN